ncbi:hypothetical protein [Phenylobacterium sp.]|uniref:hypothetical protein n=1 Tax=Phenylobacterium sp. TaxID=1871053 RepID=UPI00286C75FE|nr:hypothetical protein [Phenylobacterium sp.]
MSYAIPHWVWETVVIAVFGAAIWRGGRDERIAATGLMIGWLITKLVYSHHGQQTEWGVLAADAALLGVLTWLAMTSARYWPLFAAAFQFLAVIIHLARIADRSLGGWAYISAEILFGYLVAIAIAVGTFNAWRGQPRHPAAIGDPTDDPGAMRR